MNPADVRALLRLRFADEDQARRVEASLRADDDAFAATKRIGADVVLELSAPSLRSLLRALDDALACASVAEDVIKSPPIGRDDDA